MNSCYCSYCATCVHNFVSCETQGKEGVRGGRHHHASKQSQCAIGNSSRDAVNEKWVVIMLIIGLFGLRILHIVVWEFWLIPPGMQWVTISHDQRVLGSSFLRWKGATRTCGKNKEKTETTLLLIRFLKIFLLTQSSEFLMCCLALAISAARLLLGWGCFDADDELE